jgi:TolA-binding protein
MKFGLGIVIMALSVLSLSFDPAQAQTGDAAGEWTQRTNEFIQKYLDMIKGLINYNQDFKDQAWENKYKMREIRAKNREMQANMRRQLRDNDFKIDQLQANIQNQQRENSAKIHEAQVRQKEQMRLLRDRARR